MRGINYVRRAIMPNPVPGIVVGYQTTASPIIQNPADAARYMAAQRPNFEAFNFIYKVYQPCLYGTSDGSLLPKDFESDREEIFKRKVGAMKDITVSLSANSVQGAIPPGTYVKVKYEDIRRAKNPQIIEIGEKIFDIALAQGPPPGNPFILGGPYGAAGTVGSTGAVEGTPFVTEQAPNNPDVKGDDTGPIIGLGRYSSGVRNDNLKILERYMEQYGVTNRYVKIAILGVVSKESGLKPQSEYGWSNASVERSRKFFGGRVKMFNDTELKALMQDDVLWFSHIYGPKFFGPGSRGSWADHTGERDGYNYRGRGFNQITFKASYRKYGRLAGLDLVGNPDLLNDPEHAANAAVAFLVNGLKNPKSPVKEDINNVSSQRDANIVVARANAGWGKSLTNTSVQGAISATNKASHLFV